VSATATESPPTQRCPRCEAPLAPEQDWCLECGTAVTTRVARRPGWGVPVAIVIVTLAVAGAALFVTIGLLEDDADKAAGGSSSAPAATRTSAGTTKAQGGGPVPLWPGAKKAYTVVVAAPSSRRAAERRARALRALGRDAGVLRGADYDSFGSGVWVVWRGKYAAKPTADQAATKVKQAFPSAYVTLIRRKT
jgi:hypothetical protein